MSFLKEAWTKAVDVIAFVPRMAVKATEFVVSNGAYYGSRLTGADTETAQARYDKVKEVGETVKGAIDTAADFAKHPIQGLKNAFNENSDLNPMNWLRRTLERVTDFLLDKAQAATIRIAGEGKVSSWLGETRDKNLFIRSEEHGAGSVETTIADVEKQAAPEAQPQTYVPQAPVGGRMVMQPGF